MITYRFFDSVIEPVVSFANLKEIDGLAKELNHEAAQIDYYHLAQIVKNRFLVAMDGERIVGMGILVLSTIATDFRAHIEDVVVSEAYRRQGIASKIMDMLEAEGRRKGVRNFNLTSKSSRLEAIKLYKSRGYKRRRTNLFSLKA